MFGINKKIDKAITLYEQGHLSDSQALCLQILKSAPDNPSILITLGNIFYVKNDYDSALRYYARVLQKNQHDYPALINVANCCYELKRYDDAIRYAELALEKDSHNKHAYLVLGNSYLAQENYAQAIANLEQAVKIDSSDPWTYNTLSQAYQKNGNYIASLSNAWKAVEKSPAGDDSQHINLGYLFYEIAAEKGIEVITECVDLWNKKYGQNPVVAYIVNSLFGNTKIKSANPNYVRNIFDVFAPDFDAVLAALDYRAPALIRRSMEEVYPPSSYGKLHILDLGCGTGLCGEFLHKYAAKKSLIGVDLSSKMLEVVAGKNLYSELVNSDINRYLEYNNKYTETSFDLIVAADVFTYLGDLREVFENANKALVSGGRIIFTVSENFANKNDYFLHMSGRFLHSFSYIKNVLKMSCFELEFYHYEKLRNEGDKSVMGYIISARKPD